MKTTLGILFLCCFTLSVNAQLLWKISGNGLKEPSYIMGTHHLAPLSIKDSIQGLQAALDQTQQVYGELKMMRAHYIRGFFESVPGYFP